MSSTSREHLTSHRKGPIRGPLSAEQYRPDPSEPIDRWFQAANSSNVRTTMEILAGLSRRPTQLIDPFCGAGSTVLAARLLGIPFFGMEIDSCLTCVSITKAFCRKDHRDGLESFLANRFDPDTPTTIDVDTLMPRLMDIVLRYRARAAGRIPDTAVTADLETLSSDSVDGLIICADAADSQSWQRFRPIGEHPVVYTSPPFGTVPPADTPLGHEAHALLDALGLWTTSSTPRNTVPGYGDLVTGMLRNLVRWTATATALIEHEPTDDPSESPTQIASRIEVQTPFQVLDIVDLGSFSKRGPLSLLHCEVRTWPTQTSPAGNSKP